MLQKLMPLLICDPLTDIYNPNVIRSSIGCVFTQQVVACTTEEAIAWLKSKKDPIICCCINRKQILSSG